MKTKKIIFLIILVVAVFVRLYQLNIYPPALTWDEVSIGYNAYSILKTGKDEWGKFLPITFRAFGDYKLPVYIYADVPFVAVFGLSEWGTRLPSLLAGIGVVILTFLILKHLLDNDYLAYLGMATAALTPWFIIMSRVSLEAHLAAFLTALGVYLFLVGVKKRGLLILSAISFGLSLFCYNSNRVVILPLVLIAGIIYKKNIFKKDKLAVISLLVLLAFLAVAVPFALLQDSSARYKWTKVLDEGAILTINQLRGNSDLPAPINRLVINKLNYWLIEVTKNYLSYFGLNFLYLNGSSNFQHSVPGSGLLPWVTLPLILIGFYITLKNRKNYQLLILAWILIAPIAGAITKDAPHAPRSANLGLPLILMSIIGLNSVKKSLKPINFNILYGLIVVGLLINFALFWQNYTGNYAKRYSWSWQYGYKQAVSYLQENGDKYPRIIFTKKYGEPHEFLLFYLNYQPEKFINDPQLVRYMRSDWFWVDRFSKYEFINDWEIKEKLAGQHNILLVTSPSNYPSGGKLLREINFLDGAKAFDIVEL